jgi:predicted acetyltransferase
MIGTPAFAINLKKLFSVVEGGVEKGLVFSHRLTGKFSSIAKYDFSILVYSNYQREGIGRRVVDLILSLDAGAVFIVPKSNEKSLSFFRALNNLSHVRNGNLIVFNSL